MDGPAPGLVRDFGGVGRGGRSGRIRFLGRVPAGGASGASGSSGAGATGAVATRAADSSPSSSGSRADSLRPRPAISTTVTPSAPRTARTHTRRRWMNSEPASPAMAATAPPSAHPLPGCCEIWKLAHSSVPS